MPPCPAAHTLQERKAQISCMGLQGCLFAAALPQCCWAAVLVDLYSKSSVHMQRSQCIMAQRKGLCSPHSSAYTLSSGRLCKAEVERLCTCAPQYSSFW